MARSKEWLVLPDPQDTLFEAVDIYVEKFLPNLLNPKLDRTGNIELTFMDPTSETKTLKPVEKKFFFNISYFHGYLDIKAQVNSLIGSRNLPVPTQTVEFFFSGPLLERGQLKLTEQNLEQDAPPVSCEMTLDELAELMPETFDLFNDAMLTLLIELAIQTFDKNIFDPFTAKVKALISRTIGEDSSDLFWQISKQFKEKREREK